MLRAISGSLIFVLFLAEQSVAQKTLDLRPIETNEPSKSAFEQALEKDSGLNTKESIVDISGVKYRKIEYNTKTYYLKLLQPEQSNQDLQIICEKEGDLTNKVPHLVQGGTRMTKRTSLFIKALQQSCVDAGSTRRQRVAVDPALRVGFQIDDSPNSKLKAKSIYVTPLTPGVGFSGEW